MLSKIRIIKLCNTLLLVDNEVINIMYKKIPAHVYHKWKNNYHLKSLHVFYSFEDISLEIKNRGWQLRIYFLC